MENLIVRHTNYTPESISFGDGFSGPRGDVGFFMNADYDKAKKIIEHLLASGKIIENVEMGLDGDWSCNSMTIYEDGIFEQYDCYDASKWAEPIIIVNYLDGNNEVYSVWNREDIVDNSLANNQINFK